MESLRASPLTASSLGLVRGVAISAGLPRIYAKRPAKELLGWKIADWIEYETKVRLGDVISSISMFFAGIALFVNAKNLRRTIINKRADFIVGIYNQYHTESQTEDILQDIRLNTLGNSSSFFGPKDERSLVRLLAMMDRVASLYCMGIITRADLRPVENDLVLVFRHNEVKRYIASLRSASSSAEDEIFCERFVRVANEIYEQKKLNNERKARRAARAKHIFRFVSNIYPNSSEHLQKGFDRLADIGGQLGISFLINDLGISLGTSNVLVYVRDHGIVLREPSVVAVIAGTKVVLAVGNEAKRMLGRTPPNIVAVRPLKDGVIADFEITEAMLRHLITKVQNRAKWVRPRVIIGVPSGISEAEKLAVKNAATNAGAREVYLVESALAAAIGVGLPVHDATGNIIVDIGAGTTEVALIALSGIIRCRSIRIGGDELDEALISYLKRAYNLMIGESTAEAIKIMIGSIYPPDHEDKERTTIAKGRDLGTGLPKSQVITSQEVREAYREIVDTIVESVRSVLERCPPELVEGIADRGLVLTGGGALLRGLDDLLIQETGLPVHIAEDALSAVGEGAGAVLSELKFMRLVASSGRSER